MNKTIRGILDILFFIIIFFLIQWVVSVSVGVTCMWVNKMEWSDIYNRFLHGNFPMSSEMLVMSSVMSSVLTLCLFTWRRWAPVSRTWLAERPWAVIAWIIVLAFSSILPSQWLLEQMEVNVPQQVVEVFEQILREPAGYLAIGILAPIAEELVFRGAILRTLLALFSKRMYWIAIIISAVIFGAMHGNLPQFVHAAVIGLLLGWMYYRTDSIIPGIVFHWVNNTVAYLMFHLMPQMNDGRLIDLFHGSQRMMWLGLLFSLCMFLPSLFQLFIRLRKASNNTTDSSTR